MQRAKTKDPAAPSADSEKVKAALKTVYDDGFNIYASINRLKKEMGRKDHFPDEVLIGVCNSYWKNRDMIKARWPWFIQAMTTESNLWINRQHQAEKPDPRGPVSQSIKDIMRGAS